MLSTVPVMFNYQAKGEDILDWSRFLNDHMSELVSRYPTRFVGLGTVPLQVSSRSGLFHEFFSESAQSPLLAVEELTRCVKELGLAGVQIGSHVNEWNLDAPELFPFFEVCEHLRRV